MKTLTVRDEAVLYHRGMADLHFKMKGMDALERARLHAMAADSMEWEGICKKALGLLERGVQLAQMSEMEQKALSSLVDTSGAYTVAPLLAPEILAKGLSDLNPIRTGGATVVTVTKGDLYYWPRESQRFGVRRLRETDAHGGFTADMLLAGEGIPINYYNSTVPVSSKLWQDAAYAPEVYVNQRAIESFLVAESVDFIIGSGVLAPEGICTNGAVTVVKSGSASTITADSIRQMFYSLPAAFRRNSSWLMRDATIAVVKTLKDAQGQYLYHDGVYGLSPETLLGKPILSCPDAPAIAGGAWPIVFGDLSRYVIVDRQMLGVLVDPFSSKPNLVYDLVHRVGGQVVDPNAFVKMVVST